MQDAFYVEELVSAKLANLRRDDDRSGRSTPFARPYYLCSSLGVDQWVSAYGGCWPSPRGFGPADDRSAVPAC